MQEAPSFRVIIGPQELPEVDGRRGVITTITAVEGMPLDEAWKKLMIIRQHGGRDLAIAPRWHEGQRAYSYACIGPGDTLAFYDRDHGTTTPLVEFLSPTQQQS